MVHYEPGGQGIALWPTQLHRAALQPALQPHDGTLRQAPNKVGDRPSSQGNGNGIVGDWPKSVVALNYRYFLLPKSPQTIGLRLSAAAIFLPIVPLDTIPKIV